MDDLNLCAKCEERLGDINCSCGERFCELCFNGKHLARNPKHRRGGSQKTEDAWNWISGKISGFTNSISQASQFKQDESTKWFGLHIKTMQQDRITTIVETPRFSNLMEESLNFSKESPRRQFPSITSFVGETGAGKSTLIRSLIYHSEKAKNFEPLEAPVPGAQSGSSAIFSTTGEVNLYLDPSTFGTTTPSFFADCEGMLGTEPLASQHQNEWTKFGRRYLIQGKDIDRRTAVMTIYPRFLYIFSDVVCYVTRNHKAWADSAVRLMNWSKVGAQSTINQFALPALIIVLNGPTLENETWMSDDHDAVTNDFFLAIEKEISENKELRALAKQHGDKTMRQLFSRSFSSVYVHYIPLQGYGSLGTSLAIWEQTRRLAQRIKNDTERVQAQRAESWTRFDTKQMSLIIDYAFKHLASGSPEPFDFGQCRQQIVIPGSTETHFSEFLGYCLKKDVERRFDKSATVLASCLIRNSLSAEGKDLVLVPSVVFNKDIQAICKRAMSHFLDNNAQCAFVDPDSNEKCINTNAGHAQGHQSQLGFLLKEGLYVDSDFDSGKFLVSVETALLKLMRDINSRAQSSRQEWQRFAVEQHRRNIEALRNEGGYPKIQGEQMLNDIGRTSVCYGCLFGRPEFRMPCGHIICVSCLKDFDQTDPIRQYPGSHIHKECIVCGDSSTAGWPYQTQIRPDLAGLRILSLDGGGVRGIVELVTLKRLEKLIGLELPLGRFFDLVVGTSAGGLISLGLGAQARNMGDCIGQFRQICDSGFKNKPLTKSWLGWVARCFASSIYHTDAMENALIEAYGIDSPTVFYGLENSCRVAITTTVDQDCKLIANYDRGGKARCTSAAPMFFEPRSHDGNVCRDGGLKENNPVQIAVNESKSIWGEKVDYDLILSVGSGQAQSPQKQPVSAFIIPQWLASLFNTLLSTMNGEDAWQRYKESQDSRITNRSSRLNVKFPGQYEPALDDVKSIPSMEIAAEKYKFYERPPSTSFSPIFGSPESGQLEQLADRLRASMYFLQLSSISHHEDVTIVRGWICCRLAPAGNGFRRLLSRTTGFDVNGEFYKTPTLVNGETLKMDVNFKQQSADEAIRIDVNFGSSSHSVAISGFPMTLRVILDSWEERSGEVESLGIVELDVIPQARHISRNADSWVDTSPSRPQKADSGELKTELLIEASKSGDTNTVLGLLHQGVHVDAKHSGWTALGRASKNGHLKLVQVLIDQGAGLDIKMDVGWGFLPGDGSALNWAAAEGHLLVVELLVSSGAHINIKAEKPVFFGTGGTPLTMASGKGQLAVIEFLLNSGADEDTKEHIPGWDAFLCACEKGQLKCVEYFVLKRKFDVNRKSQDGIAPLHLATKGERLDVMNFLVANGAVLSVKDKDGSTPMHYVALKGRRRTAVWLRRKGADLTIRNNAGKTPLEVAKARLAESKSNTNEELVKSLQGVPEPESDSDESGCVSM